MNALDQIFQRSGGYIVAAMIPEKAYVDSNIKEVVMRVKRTQNKPKKLEKVQISAYLAQIDDLKT